MNQQLMEEKSLFEAQGFGEEGMMYWWASWYAGFLDYRSLKTFMRPMFQAIQACHALNFDPGENFVEVRRHERRRTWRDYKLTRFACYLIAMNADSRKSLVAQAQRYFAGQMEQYGLQLEGGKDVGRLLLREEIKDNHHHLTSAAAQSGVTDFREFMNEGYYGLYDKPVRQVKVDRDLDGNDNLYEFMGAAELSANLLRITLTEERLRRSPIQNAYEAETIHRLIGSDVRRLVRSHTGCYPEELPTERSLQEVSAELKKAGRLLNGFPKSDAVTIPS